MEKINIGCLEISNEGFIDEHYGFQIMRKHPLGGFKSFCVDYITPNELRSLADLMEKTLHDKGLSPSDIVDKREMLQGLMVDVVFNFNSHFYTWTKEQEVSGGLYYQRLKNDCFYMKANKSNFYEKPKYENTLVYVCMISVNGDYLGWINIPYNCLTVINQAHNHG